MSTHGKRLLQDRWTGHEFDVLSVLWSAGCAANPNGLNFLHRDVVNVCSWFARRGVQDDPEELFADLLAVAFG